MIRLPHLNTTRRDITRESERQGLPACCQSRKDISQIYRASFETLQWVIAPSTDPSTLPNKKSVSSKIRFQMALVAIARMMVC